MSDSAPPAPPSPPAPPVPPLYSVDSSSFMDWQARFYPKDVFPGLAAKVEELVAAQRFVAPELVKEEIGVVGTPDLVQWAEDNNAIFVPDVSLLADAQVIQNQFSGFRDPKSEFEEADAYIIALAKTRGGIVVTQETPAAEKHRPRRTHFIPDVCRELGIPCISFLGLVRREGWSF